MSMFVGDIYSHILFLGFGFIGGILVGQFLRGVVLEERNREETKLNRRVTLNQVYGIATVVLTMLALVTVFFSIQEQQRVTACQAQYNAHFTAVVKARTDAATNDRNAQIKLSKTLIELIDSSTDSRPTGEQRQAALDKWRQAQQEYIDTLNRSDVERAENQYPLPPNCK